MVNLYWNQTCTAPVGLRRPRLHAGTYGYYQLRGGFTSALRLRLGHLPQQLGPLPPGLLDDRRPVHRQRRRPDGAGVHPLVQPRIHPEARSSSTSTDKLAPSVGIVYDVFGDSTLKIFGSFGIYYDVMKLYLAEGSYGGLKWITQYYALNDYDFWKIGNEFAAGIDSADAREDQEGGEYVDGVMQPGLNEYKGIHQLPRPLVRDDRPRPQARGPAGGLLRRGKEADRGPVHILAPRPEAPHPDDRGRRIRSASRRRELLQRQPRQRLYPGEVPGDPQQFRSRRPKGPVRSTGEDYWTQPDAKREYYGMNVSLEKRFSHNWQGGINYTLSRVEGNYSGLSSSDEGGRNSPNVERFFDMWFMMFRLDGQRLDGPLPQDRTHYFKAYGSYAFPFGLDGRRRRLRPQRPARQHPAAGPQQLHLPKRLRRPGPAALHVLGRHLPGICVQDPGQVQHLAQPPGQQLHQHQDLAIQVHRPQPELHVDRRLAVPGPGLRLGGGIGDARRSLLEEHQLQQLHLPLRKLVRPFRRPVLASEQKLKLKHKGPPPAGGRAFFCLSRNRLPASSGGRSRKNGKMMGHPFPFFYPEINWK
ncbi:MAG: hypothetical protein M0C28_00895 [Candidatus Moduliflexus flocculans]|nr:hypothetical protein [Candidatus Moduliflexus flocculans]